MVAVVGRANPNEAHAALGADASAVLIDVRSRMEYDYVGHPPGAVHVPWKEYPDWQVTASFAAAVRAALLSRGVDVPEEAQLYLLCRSGGRSMAAAEELIRQGYRNVFNIEEGFEGDKDQNSHRSTINGWRFRGLPWEQS